ncbi:MAG: ice-binding family protein [Bryobacteraceae bacterium]
MFWQAGSSATLDTGTTSAGNILAFTSITTNTGATIVWGRALARTGAVTMDTNTITDACGLDFNSRLGDFGSAGFAGNSVLEPGTVPLLCLGLLALTLYGWQSRKRMA